MNNIIKFEFGAADIRTAVDEHGEPWFVAKDVCDVLKISKYRDALAGLDEDERVSISVDTLGGKQDMAAVNESGLYALIFRSRHPSARRFQKWATSEVLPSIRKTGGYHVNGEVQKALISLSARVSALEGGSRTHTYAEDPLQRGSVLRAMLDAHRMTVSGLSRVSGINRSHIHEHLSGKCNIGRKAALGYAYAFDADPLTFYKNAQ